MDRSGTLPAKRAIEVFETVGACPVSPALRLYEDSPDLASAIQIAIDRAGTHSSALGPQDLNRQQAALALGVSIKTLRHLEAGEQVRPVKRGRSVVYTPECLQSARRVLESRSNS